MSYCKIFNVTKRFGLAREGHAGIMFSILALPLVLAIGFVIDFAQANRSRSELQNVADAVALAAVNALPISVAAGQNAGDSMYEAMMQSVRAGLLTDDVVITFETEPSFRAIVEITATAQGTFGNNIGLGTFRFVLDAEALIGKSSTEIGFVIDLSGSMETARMRSLGNAMALFDSTMNTSGSPAQDVRVAVVPFAQSVTLPAYAAEWMAKPADIEAAAALGRTCFQRNSLKDETSSATPQYLNLGIETNYATKCMAEVSFALTRDFGAFRAMASKLQNPPKERERWQNFIGTPYFGTAIYNGASWMSRFLDAGWSNYLPATATPKPSGRATKYAIIMTDGDQLEVQGVSRSQADTALLALCKDMRDRGIIIYTVGLEVSASSKTLLEKCAYVKERFIAADKAGDLEAAFTSIAQSIKTNRARLVY